MKKYYVWITIISGLLILGFGLLFSQENIISIFSYDDSITRADIRWIIGVTQFIAVFLGSLILINYKSVYIAQKLVSSWLVFLSILIGLTIAEITVRVFKPTPGGFPKGELLFEPDSLLGWRFVKNVGTDVVWANEAEAFVKINADGFREKDSINSSDFWVIGDSFVSALEVDEDERFTDILETHHKKQIYNFGVNGFGPVQYAILLRELLENNTPKHILVMIYLRNDLYDASGIFDWTHGLKRPIIQDDTLVYPQNKLADEVVMNQRRYLNRNKLRPEFFHLYNLFIKTFIKHASKIKTVSELDLAKTNQSDDLKISLKATKEALLMVNEITKTKSVKLTFVLAPSYLQVYPDVWDAYLKEQNLPESEYDLLLVNHELARFFEYQQFSYIDLTEGLRKAAKQTSKSLYFQVNQHWTPEGHRKVAKVLSAEFKPLTN